MSGNNIQLHKIFDLNIDNEDNIQDLLDIYVNQKLLEVDNSVSYFSKCFKRENISEINQSCVIRCFLNYILIDMEGNTIESIINNINESNLNFIESFFKYIVNNNNLDIINSFKFAYIEIPYGYERLSKLEILFKSKFIRENIFQEIFENGIINETKGYFTLFNDIPSKGWDVNINPVKPILDLFINDNESCSKLIKLIKQHLELNISYTYTQHKYININKCSSIKYICFLLKVMLYIFEKKSISLQTFDPVKELSLQRPEYELNDNDNLITQIIIITLYAIKIAYIPLPRIYYIINRERQLYETQLNFDFASDNLLKNMSDIELKFTRISGIFKDKQFHNQILNFIENITKYNAFISDDVAHNIGEFVISCIIDNEIKTLPTPIIDYILKTVNGDYGANKHTRFQACTILIIICDTLGYSFFVNLITENQNIIENLFFAIIKFIIEIDHFEWTTHKISHKFYQEMLNMISYYSSKINISKINKDISILFHKMTSKMNTLITEMANLCQKITEKIKPNTDISYIRDECKYIMNEYVKSLMSCILTIQNLIKNNILDIKTLPVELILPFSSFSVALLTLLSNGKDPIYTIFQMNMETLDLMKELFKLINMGCSNSNFTETIKDNINIIKVMVSRIKLDYDLRNSLINHLGNIDKDSDHLDDLPDEFIDPILAIEIKNPVMIPKIDKIFDRASIMSHLYYEESNPFTRDTLTIKEFEEYNKRDYVKDKIAEFINKFNEYKMSKRK